MLPVVAYLRGAYFAVLIYSSDVGDGYGRVHFAKVAKLIQFDSLLLSTLLNYEATKTTYTELLFSHSFFYQGVTG